MSRKRSKAWWWIGALLVTAMMWRGCGACSGETIETTLHVKLRPGAGAAAISSLDGATVMDEAHLFTRPEAMSNSELSAWRRVHVRGTRKAIDKAIESLQEQKDVLTAFEAPHAELPVVRDDEAKKAAADNDSCPIKTPSYRPQQGYLDAAPGGINAPIAWRERGGRGSAVWFADIEGAWNAKHEDLPTDRIHAIGRPMSGRDWEMHGTAVLGEVVSRDNDLGMLGIAPDVGRVVTSSITDVPAATAIDLAQAVLRPGDVLLIELHAIGPRGRFLPMEYWDDVFDAIKTATARGVVVIEAAGNGAEDLDHEAYKGKLDRRVRDSGAIMVGAGAPALKGWTDRSRLDFSNFGSRVDVQGWGRMVATDDYGDLQGCDATGRKYTNTFAGTSSASPVVAGAALLVESIFKTERGYAIAPADLRRVLSETGSPQTDGPHGSAKQRIGPRPDLARAIDRARSL